MGREEVGPGLGVQSSSRQPIDDGDGWVPSVVLHELSPAPATAPLLLLLTRAEPLSNLLPSLLTSTGTETLFGDEF